MWCEEFMSRLSFPDDAAEYIKNEDFQNTAIKAAAKRFYYEGAPMNDTLFLLRRVKNENTHIYTAQLLFVIACAEFLKKSYEELKLPEDIYWDTMNDVKCKLIECKAVHNIWGTFEPEWYNGFFRLKRFALDGFNLKRLCLNGMIIQSTDTPFIKEIGYTIFIFRQTDSRLPKMRFWIRSDVHTIFLRLTETVILCL